MFVTSDLKQPKQNQLKLINIKQKKGNTINNRAEINHDRVHIQYDYSSRARRNIFHILYQINRNYLLNK